MADPVEAPRIWLIAGPTASGKSALALRLAELTHGELINADALQLYYDLRVLTARPSVEEEARAPHHLFGVADAIDTWSVGRWLTAAHAALADIAARGRPAIVVGGTGLYFKALTEGLAAIPPVPQWVRSAVSDHYDALGEDSFRAALAMFDPASAERIAPGDRQRLMRAREVYDATGKPLSAWHEETAAALSPHDWSPAVLTPPREVLYARCDARLAQMIDQGALEEVRALMAQGLGPLIPVMKAVGLRELASYIAQERTLDDAVAAARQETRRYAKRQLTWFRNQTPDWPKIEAEDHEAQWRQFLALNPSLTPLP